MSFNKENHPDEEQLIRAIVDEDKLPDSIREHLSLCPRCRADIKKIEQELNTLSKTARQLVPATCRKISLPVEKPSRIYRWLHDWRVSFGAIATVAVAVLVIWLSIPGTILYENSLDIMDQATWDDDVFITEINMLTQNAIPQVYLDIIGEYYVGIDDEFIKFVISDFETNSLSYYQKRKGVKSC
jgi:hypothetical protein